MQTIDYCFLSTLGLFSIIRFNIKLLTFAKFVRFLKSKADLNVSIHRVENGDCNLVESDKNSNCKFISFKVKSPQYAVI